MKRIFILALLALVCSCNTETDFYRRERTQILLGNTPQYFVGANFWCAGKLALEDRARLEAELDSLKAIGVTNLRVLAADSDCIPGLDIALKEMRRRGMCAVLYLNNCWDWSTCFADYLEKAGAGAQPRCDREGYPAYMKAMAEFSNNREAQDISREHVRAIVERYREEPAVFSWQIANEPRCFSDDPLTRDNFVKYIHETAAFIKSLDSNHMVSTGNEGTMGCEKDTELYRRINDCRDIDYVTIHIWPFNWSWADRDSVVENADRSVRMLEEYLDRNLAVAKDLGKPLVIEEFGYPRDGFSFEESAPTTGRDKIYGKVFSRIVESAKQGLNLAGCNFWTWEIDPPQEDQGLNAVLHSDSTVGLIRETTRTLDNTPVVYAPLDLSCLMTGDGPFQLKAYVSCPGVSETDMTLKLVRDTTLMSESPDTAYEFFNRVQLDGKKAAEVTFLLGTPEPGAYRAVFSNFPSFNILINPEDIISPQSKEPDFDSFWEETLGELAAVDPEYELVPDPEHSDSVRNAYTVYMKSLGGVTIGGYYMEPVAEGQYKAIIDYMGYGAQPYHYGPQDRPDAIQFLVSVRGQGIFREPDASWIKRGMDNRDDYYYRGAFCDVKRAVDFIASRPKTDQEHIFVEGESQGGAFAWIAAALDDRVRAVAPSVPFLSDYPDYAKIVVWPMQDVINTATAEGIAPDDLFRTLSYFDVKNFTDRISCPVFMAFGLQDSTCPPHTNFAGYNMVKSEKKYFCVPTCGHAMWKEPSWKEAREEWFNSML
ncbi:MAG: acetylxylan esterase [Bacteroidales bacterium]|nr:acetylxylan esterase [Bacteroidales bacterium]